MKKTKKWSRTVALVAVLALGSALSACSNSNAPEATQSPTQNASGEGGEGGKVAEDPVNAKFDPPVVMTVATLHEPKENDFKAGETIDDNVAIRWLKDNMGIEVKHDFVVTTGDDYDTKFQLLLASNGKLPDVFKGPKNGSDLIKSGRLLDITDAIEQYASPNLKALYEKFPEGFNGLTKDGKTYGLPFFSLMDEGAVMWIREDWLTKLSLKAPTTIEELEVVMKAFSEQDPDGNSKDDTFGMALSLNETPVMWMATADPIVGALTDVMADPLNINGYWSEKDGQLQYGAIDPSVKNYLTKMREWIETGYVDNEAGVKDPMKAVEILVNGKAGITFGPNWMGQWPLEDVGKNIEGASFKAYPLPAGPNGKVARAGKNPVAGNILFSKDFKHIDAYFAVLNKLYAKSFGSEDPYFDERFKDGWFEGYDFALHDGKVVKRDFKAAGVPEDKWPTPSGEGEGIKPIWTFLGTGGTAIPYQGESAYQKFMDDPNATPVTEAEDRIKSMNRAQIEAGVVSLSQKEADVFNKFNAPATPAMEKHGEILTKLAKETYLRILYGDEPVEYFDKFVEEWKKNGGDQVTKEVNEWYATVK